MYTLLYDELYFEQGVKSLGCADIRKYRDLGRKEFLAMLNNLMKELK